MNGNTTTYLLDLNAGLTQVLSDSENTYTYGLGRISQTNTETEYFLGDALGSVRQLTNTAGEVTLSKTYNPYGENVSSAGDAQTAYGFTGEYTDSTGNIYLRARYYNPNDGRFLSRDTWVGDYKHPLTFNKWGYAELNPIINTDPSGYCSQVGWDDQSGIFTEANCDRLEEGDLEFTKEWYYAFADYVQGTLPQTAANFRHYLDGSGSELHLQPTFMRQRIYEWPHLKNSVDKLVTWYVRTYFDQGEECPIAVVPDIFAAQFTPPFHQAWQYWPGDKSQMDISGSIGTFRLDVEIKGTLDNYQNNFWSDTLGTNLSLHLVVLDIYNWHGGLNVFYEGNAIEDKWAGSLADAGLAKPFIVRGDLFVDFNQTISSGLFGFGGGANPPNGWVNASCIGSQFDIDQEGPGQVDYCGNPMR